jgi:hypothetical protein
VTKQTTGSSTTRETGAEYRGRPVVVEIHAGFLVARLKGTQTRWSADWASVAEWIEMRTAKQVAGDIPPRK